MSISHQMDYSEPSPQPGTDFNFKESEEIPRNRIQQSFERSSPSPSSQARRQAGRQAWHMQLAMTVSW